MADGRSRLAICNELDEEAVLQAMADSGCVVVSNDECTDTEREDRSRRATAFIMVDHLKSALRPPSGE